MTTKLFTIVFRADTGNRKIVNLDILKKQENQNLKNGQKFLAVSHFIIMIIHIDQQNVARS